MLNKLKNKKGIVLIIVMSFMGLIVLSTVSLATMIQQDVRLIEWVREKEQARFLAEAGINHALSKIKVNGFASRADFSGNLDTGSYSVAFSEVGGRYLITSVGTVSGISKTVTAEIAGDTPTALNYFSGAGNDINMQAQIALCQINGDIHANHDVNLRAGFFSTLIVNGDVSASHHVYTSTGFWGTLQINGSITEDADSITFPRFDYDAYKQVAQEAGDYYNSDAVFTGTLSPANGIIYVKGTATFIGACTLTGGIIAKQIKIGDDDNSADFYQHKNELVNRNVIIAKNGDIKIWGRFDVQEALVYAEKSIKIKENWSIANVTGILLAGENIEMWNKFTLITFNYRNVIPENMTNADGEEIFQLISWNK
ncbi:MAG: pilus assembly PilX N-terminal domain-containing protein [Candidatus Omnitrophota bacterium]